MAIRINDLCMTCKEGAMKKLASYPTMRGIRAYLFECTSCDKNIVITGTTNVPEEIEYIKTETVSRG